MWKCVYAMHTKKQMLMRNLAGGVDLPFPYDKMRPVTPGVLEGLIRRKLLFLPDPEEYDFDPQNLRLVLTPQKLFVWYMTEKEKYCMMFHDRCSSQHKPCVKQEKPKMSIKRNVFHQLQWKNGENLLPFFWLQTV